MGNNIKVGDIVTVPGTVNGYGVDIRSEVEMIEECLGYVLVSVRYIEPHEVGFRRGTTCHDFQLIKN